ncbi:alpha/beta hydrolase [Streptomyces sp. NPDC002143]
MTTTENPHLATELRFEGPQPPDAALAAVLVHGRGQDPDFMAEVAGRIGMSDVRSVLPAASGNSWYPGRFMDPFEQNEPWLTHALDAIDHALAALEAEGFAAGRTALIGFSQGACLLAEYLVRRPAPFPAVALLTGGCLGPDDTARRPAGALPGTRVLLSSSRFDDWVPPGRVQQTAALLQDMGAAVTLCLHDAPEHGVDDAETRAVRDLLDAVSPTTA